MSVRKKEVYKMERRDFLKKLAIGGSAVVLTPLILGDLKKRVVNNPKEKITSPIGESDFIINTTTKEISYNGDDKQFSILDFHRYLMDKWDV